MNEKRYWLLKSEPSCWSFEDQCKHKITSWDGVRNYQAQGYLKQMNINDECFFYHSQVRELVGIVKVIKTFYPEKNDMRFGQVDVEIVRPLKRPISLKEIKTHPELSQLPLIKQSRLSVMPIDKKSWDFIVKIENENFIKI